MASPYRLYGGAQRPDALNFNADFSTALNALFAAAPPEVQRELGLTSGFRDRATQQRLFDASDRTGHSVARPGHSRHESGQAADLFGFGLKDNGSVSDATKQWVHQNAGRFGLAFPMDYEPWHIQLAGGGGNNQLVGSAGGDQLDAQMKAAGYTPEQRRNAIASIESAGSGDYGALGPTTGEDRDRAYGRYQVMGSNVGPWAEQYLKMQGVTPEQYLKDPALQDKLFDAVYGDYVSKYGERGAASKWFTGSENEPARSDVLGKLTGKTYADRYMEALGGSGGATGTSSFVDASGGAAGGGASPYVLPDKKKDDPKSKFGEALSSAIAGFAGSGNQQLPAQPPIPQAARADATVAPIFDPQVAQANRDRLAQIMAALNQNSAGGRTA